jgi:hypothetical protein
MEEHKSVENESNSPLAITPTDFSLASGDLPEFIPEFPTRGSRRLKCCFLFNFLGLSSLSSTPANVDPLPLLVSFTDPSRDKASILFHVIDWTFDVSYYLQFPTKLEHSLNTNGQGWG